MTTKPLSSAPWADEPIALIPIPSNHKDPQTHAAVMGAGEMAHAHNCLLRGINAIIQQAPHVPDASQPQYNEQDVRDLLFYVAAWVKVVHHHHDAEELTMFPDIERWTGRPGLMQGAKDQHAAFHGGLELLLRYAEGTDPEEYRWKGGMKEIIDGFVDPLAQHLSEEIDLLLSLKELDSEGFKEIWKETERVAKATGEIALLYDIFPLVLGASDQTYQGGNDFPPLPWVTPYAIKYWFGAGNGAWRFSPCDFWGNPRPLQFVPEETTQQK